MCFQSFVRVKLLGYVVVYKALNDCIPKLACALKASMRCQIEQLFWLINRLIKNYNVLINSFIPYKFSHIFKSIFTAVILQTLFGFFSRAAATKERQENVFKVVIKWQTAGSLEITMAAPSTSLFVPASCHPIPNSYAGGRMCARHLMWERKRARGGKSIKRCWIQRLNIPIFCQSKGASVCVRWITDICSLQLLVEAK